MYIRTLPCISGSSQMELVLNIKINVDVNVELHVLGVTPSLSQ